MLAHRLRRRPDIKTTLRQRLVFGVRWEQHLALIVGLIRQR